MSERNVFILEINEHTICKGVVLWPQTGAETGYGRQGGMGNVEKHSAAKHAKVVNTSTIW